MSKALIFMVVIGTAIGLAWPGDEPAAAPLASGASRETTLVREGNGHFYAHAKVNGQLVRFVIDTGATVVALTVEDAMRLGIPVNPASFEVIGEGASGLVRGQNVTLDSVEIDGKRVENVSASVLEGSRLSLLGQSYLSRMGEVQMKGDYMVLK
ncbi:MAG: TIGR02281 family clan AA aspartic protease [Pseudomonadota bacterium]|nr:TIGR02281 family clan AA aspartic protease [Pseudomonadota bacterium]